MKSFGLDIITLTLASLFVYAEAANNNAVKKTSDSSTITSTLAPSSTEVDNALLPWVRTIDLSTTTIISRVTPEVISLNTKDIITISAKPTATLDQLKSQLRPWVSIKKDGSPKTIKPKLANGHEVKNGGYDLIDYSTYFMEATTKTFSYEEMGKPAGMKPGEEHVEKIQEFEDPFYEWDLNPIMRCFPGNYNKMNPKNQIVYKQDKNNKEFETNVKLTSEPFCAPKENTVWKMDKTYFTHWYYKFFYDDDNEEYAEKVKIHLTYITESYKDQGMNKRDSSSDGEQLSFWSSDWVSNKQGFLPIYINETFLKDSFEEKILITIQPDYMSDVEFHPLMAEFNPVKLSIIKGTKIAKQNGDDLEFKHWGTEKQQSKYGKGKTILEIIIIIPSVVLVAFIAMFIFVKINGKNRDFSNIKKFRKSKLNKTINMSKFKNHKYEELPMHDLKPERHRL
ncbi:hypothetical protein HANVADRAFT_52026 [Hanseniaspora valbyensis NRRL Y-1626]|uniref:Uncharacterized protein n=1 Tax=Hanseniaspora valbyensis NRRL Y-1626 TaxID=766949 RepID=A0A1B7TGT1_9ASCO|nr:hypothetical protein HANVADRAFT_52026 [Hanseniaspora valbyensis NRRL Y-1626]